MYNWLGDRSWFQVSHQGSPATSNWYTGGQGQGATIVKRPGTAVPADAARNGTGPRAFDAVPGWPGRQHMVPRAFIRQLIPIGFLGVLGRLRKLTPGALRASPETTSTACIFSRSAVVLQGTKSSDAGLLQVLHDLVDASGRAAS